MERSVSEARPRCSSYTHEGRRAGREERFGKPACARLTSMRLRLESRVVLLVVSASCASATAGRSCRMNRVDGILEATGTNPAFSSPMET